MLKHLLIILLLFHSAASARMYQWLDPESGSTQLSGKPPMWYRSSESGPRVFVFDRNKVIDDTGIAVSEEERQRLRQKAFLQADEDKNEARADLLKSKRIDAALQFKQQQALSKEEQERPVLEDEYIVEQVQRKPIAVPEKTTLEQMRKLIEDWEKATTEQARGLLEAPAAGAE